MCLGAAAVFAQDAATLSGTVLDPSGAILPGATVRLVEERRGLVRHAQSDLDGLFGFVSLEPGEYSLEATAKGFGKTSIRSMTLRARDRRNLRLTLQLEEISQSMDITGKEDIVASDPSFGAVVEQSAMRDLPLAGRSIDTLLLLAPGTSSAAAGAEINSNGMRSNTNYYTLDGVSLSAGLPMLSSAGMPGPMGRMMGMASGASSSASQGAPTELVSMEALQEVRVQTSSFAPEFGRTPGAQIAMTSRGGGDRFHGSLFEYFGNDRLNANEWFANSIGQPRAALRYNQFGGTLGGPLRRGKTHFFASYEGLRLLEPETNIAIVPDDTVRQTASAALRPYLNAFPVANGAALTGGAAIFSAVYSNPSSRDSASLRLDHALSARHSMFLRYAVAPSDGLSRGEGSQTPNVLNSRDMRPQSLTGSLVSIVSPNIVNDLRVNVTRTSLFASSAMDAFGGATPLTAAQMFPTGVTADDGQFTLNVAGLSGYSHGAQTATIQRQFNAVESLAVTAGTHQYKIGVDFRMLTPTYRYKLYGQSAVFNGLRAANGSTDTAIVSTGSLLSGTATSATVSASVPEVNPMTINNSVYVQDTARLSRTSTFTFGARWDVNPPPKSRGGDKPYAMCAEELGSCAITQQLPLYDTRWSNIALRVGLATQLSDKPGRELTLRAGWGVFHDIGYGASTNAFTGAPYVSTRNLVLAAFPLTAANTALPALPQGAPYGQVSAAERGLQSPSIRQWNLTLERNFGASQTVSAGVVGSRGSRLLRTETSRAATYAYDVLRLATNGAESNYNALQMQYRRRLSRGLQAQASYTWGHSLDSASSDSAFGGGFRSLFDGQLGNSDFDVRHTVSGVVSYNLPAPRQGALRPLLAGWWTDGIFTARTGLPFDVIGFTAIPEVLDTTTGALTTRGLFAQVRPDLTGLPLWIADPSVPGGQRLNPAAFSIPTDFRQRSLGRNVIRGHALAQADLSLRRVFRLGERATVSFAAQALNVLNRANFANPSATEGLNLASPNFGVVTNIVTDAAGGGYFSRGGPRSVQFSLRLGF